ncbi:MAG: MarR family transcriptional regulator [Acidimicrobiia bacterium]|nr:MarR family transcriptional regulator [Acidimicrobiia bacterium]
MSDLPPDHEAWGLLHDLRLRGLVEESGHEHTDLLVEIGFVVRKRTYLAVTPEGRERHAAWVRLADDAPEYAAVHRAYEAFLPLNAELIRLCSDWQVRPGNVPNDHSDLRYDWGVVDRLRALDERAGGVVRRLARSVPRFAAYRARLHDSLRKLEDGDNDWFTSPRIDSYHTVWMHMHEDLLATLGLRREDEEPAS